MIIPFNLPHVYCSGSSDEENAVVLRPLLECLVAIDMEYLQRHPTPPLRSSGVRYGRTYQWDCVPAVLAKRVADCKSLTAWDVAERRLRGEKAKPIFKVFPRRFGAPDFHIWTWTPSGEIDTSAELGMNQYLQDAARMRRVG